MRMVMFIEKFFAQQLGQPSRIVSWIIAPLWNKRNAVLNDMALTQLALTATDRVLEVGFGGGYLLGKLQKIVTNGFLAGVDVSPAMVAFCEKRYHALLNAHRLEIKCARAEALPFPAEHFTKVCTVNSIFYWQDVSRAMTEFGRVLTPNGLLVLCFTRKESLAHRGFAKQGLGLYEPDEIQQILESIGFGEIRVIDSADRYRQFVCMLGRKR